MLSGVFCAARLQEVRRISRCACAGWAQERVASFVWYVCCKAGSGEGVACWLLWTCRIGGRETEWRVSSGVWASITRARQLLVDVPKRHGAASLVWCVVRGQGLKRAGGGHAGSAEEWCVVQSKASITRAYQLLVGVLKRRGVASLICCVVGGQT